MTEMVPGDSDAVFNLKQVAQRLGVHYMTAYRYVRTGRLTARRDGAIWLVDAASLAAFEQGVTGATSVDPCDRAAEPETTSVDWVGRLTSRFLIGDEAGAWALISDALVAGFDAEAVLVRLIGPAVAAIEPDHGPAAGHLAAATARRCGTLIAARFRPRGRHRGTVVLGAPSGEAHSLGLSLLADLLRVRNVAVLELGGGASPAAFVDAAASAERLAAVAIGVTDRSHLEVARDVVLALREQFDEVKIMLGGPAVADDGMAELAGADAYSNDLAGVGALVDELLKPRSPRRSTRSRQKSSSKATEPVIPT